MKEKHFYTLDKYYKEKFGSKVFKCSLDAGFTCPNRDGTLDVKGCIFCTRTPFIGNKKDSLIEQFEKMKEVLHKKWKTNKYIIYLEAGSNTYGSIDKLKSIYEPLIKLDGVVGLSIGTRCDCLSEDVLDYLEDLNKRTYLSVELGLQSSNNETLKYINRRHTREDFKKAVKKLKKRNIEVVAHIINGLPTDTEDDMLNTIKFLNEIKIDGIKIHMLYLEKNSLLTKMYMKSKFPILSKDEYIKIVAKQISILDKNIVIHRITGDPDRNLVIEPKWIVKKFEVLNGIDDYLEKHNIYQGCKFKKEMDVK